MANAALISDYSPSFLILCLLTCGYTSLDEYRHNGFNVGPNYGRPSAPVTQDWIDAADVRVRKDIDDLSQWWTVFHDPVLDALRGHATPGAWSVNTT